MLPNGTDALVGTTVKLIILGDVTFNTAALLVILLVAPTRMAVIEVCPICRAVAKPVAEILAVAVTLLFQMVDTEEVIVSVEPSLKIPMAVNCAVVPAGA